MKSLISRGRTESISTLSSGPPGVLHSWEQPVEGESCAFKDVLKEVTVELGKGLQRVGGLGRRREIPYIYIRFMITFA
jgi:hypothetical protein